MVTFLTSTPPSTGTGQPNSCRDKSERKHRSWKAGHEVNSKNAPVRPQVKVPKMALIARDHENCVVYSVLQNHWNLWVSPQQHLMFDSDVARTRPFEPGIKSYSEYRDPNRKWFSRSRRIAQRSTKTYTERKDKHFDGNTLQTSPAVTFPPGFSMPSRQPPCTAFRSLRRCCLPSLIPP